MPAMAVCALIVLDPRADPRHPRPEPARPERGQRPRATCGTRTSRRSATPRPGSPRRGRSSSACRSASASSSTTPSYMKKKDDVVAVGPDRVGDQRAVRGRLRRHDHADRGVRLPRALRARRRRSRPASFGLGFTTLPVVFAHMGAFGNVIGALWFFMLFLAAITSSLSMYQPAVALLAGVARLDAHGKATTLLVAIGTDRLRSWSCATRPAASFGSTLDDWVGTLLIFVLAGGPDHLLRLGVRHRARLEGDAPRRRTSGSRRSSRSS